MLASSFGCDEGLWQLMIKVHVWENYVVFGDYSKGLCEIIWSLKN
jgi:hypothetical protein